MMLFGPFFDEHACTIIALPSFEFKFGGERSPAVRSSLFRETVAKPDLKGHFIMSKTAETVAFGSPTILGQKGHCTMCIATSRPLTHPSLHSLSTLPDRLFAPLTNLLPSQLNLLPPFNRRPTNPQMVLRNQWRFLFISPHQVRDIPGREWKYNPCGSQANCERYRGP